MTDSRAIHSAVRWYFALAVPFLLVVGCLRLLLSQPFLQAEYRRAGFPADPFGFTLEDRLAYGPYAINYIYNAETRDYLAALRLPGDKCWNLGTAGADCALFSEREIQHMADVKRITGSAYSLAAVCALVGAVIAFASRHSEASRADIALGFSRGCKLTLSAVALSAVLALAAWNQAFDAFHEVFFAEGSWRFPFSDSLIRLYPEQLFIDAALIIALFTSLCAGAILRLLHIRGKRRQRQR